MFQLPPVPKNGSAILPLLTPDEIFQAELAVIESAQPKEALFLSQYDLPELWDGPPAATLASQAQREILWKLSDQIVKHRVKVFLIADNGDLSVPGEKPHNIMLKHNVILSEDCAKWKTEGLTTFAIERDTSCPMKSDSATCSLTNCSQADSLAHSFHNQATLHYLQKIGAFALPYPKQYVLINHTKFLASQNYCVVTSANLSRHESDFLDDNTGFLIAGEGAKEGISHVFLPQWAFSVRKDSTGWASRYPSLQHKLKSISSPSESGKEILWLNTAPREEFCGNSNVTEIKEAYEELIEKTALDSSSSLYLAQFDVSNLELVSLLLAAREKNPNLDIRILLDPYQYLRGLSLPNKIGGEDPRVTAFRELKESGIPCRFPKRKSVPEKSELPQLFHDKFVVSSQGEVINGSANFSYHSLNGNDGVNHSLHNREADVWIRNPAIALSFLEKFQRDWENSTEDPKEALSG